MVMPTVLINCILNFNWLRGHKRVVIFLFRFVKDDSNLESWANSVHNISFLEWLRLRDDHYIYFSIWLAGYRDDSLETVKRNRDQYQIPLKILSYEELYGWTMDKVNKTENSLKNCSYRFIYVTVYILDHVTFFFKIK
jgi:hypothetical protein